MTTIRVLDQKELRLVSGGVPPALVAIAAVTAGTAAANGLLSLGKEFGRALFYLTHA